MMVGNCSRGEMEMKMKMKMEMEMEEIGYTYHWQHPQKAQEEDNHNAAGGDTKLHFEESDGTLTMPPDGQQHNKRRR